MSAILVRLSPGAASPPNERRTVGATKPRSARHAAPSDPPYKVLFHDPGLFEEAVRLVAPELADLLDFETVTPSTRSTSRHSTASACRTSSVASSSRRAGSATAAGATFWRCLNSKPATTRTWRGACATNAGALGRSESGRRQEAWPGRRRGTGHGAGACRSAPPTGGIAVRYRRCRPSGSATGGRSTWATWTATARRKCWPATATARWATTGGRQRRVCLRRCRGQGKPVDYGEMPKGRRFDPN